jgi:hypothetical protein
MLYIVMEVQVQVDTVPDLISQGVLRVQIVAGQNFSKQGMWLFRRRGQRFLDDRHPK